ncbi:hypothetical protein PCASD_03856 [Puccinia coronata f. sp. avenae]|uniref:Uncharacterized protein n=1 Tax=Puccinia coronata f. sp. avenae TaxID=200324 RepID=A0A2N5V2T4_9BASI|nr:hypothetical protein PCASD_03856 [Puccinia coronata f. sp. avenae]
MTVLFKRCQFSCAENDPISSAHYSGQSPPQTCISHPLQQPMKSGPSGWLTLWNSTKLDLLDEFNEIQVGVDCKLDKKTMEYFPA